MNIFNYLKDKILSPFRRSPTLKPLIHHLTLEEVVVQALEDKVVNLKVEDKDGCHIIKVTHEV